MINRIVYTTLIFFLFLLTGSTFAAQNSSITTTITVKVGNKEKVSQDLIRYAERLGGYFTNLTDNHMAIKVPSKKTDLFIKRVTKSGDILKKGYETKDYTFELNRKKSSLKAKKKVLKQYMDVLKSSSTGNLLYVENEVVNLVGEIERLEGSIRFLEHKLEYSKITVHFRFRNRQGPRTTRSSFQWLNTVNLKDLIGGFRYE